MKFISLARSTACLHALMPEGARFRWSFSQYSCITHHSLYGLLYNAYYHLTRKPKVLHSIETILSHRARLQVNFTQRPDDCQAMYWGLAIGEIPSVLAGFLAIVDDISLDHSTCVGPILRSNDKNPGLVQTLLLKNEGKRSWLTSPLGFLCVPVTPHPLLHLSDISCSFS